MQKITPETEQRLLTVIEKTAEHVSAGASPNAAIIKAATDAQLRPSEISLVVHAYNTGRTSRQRQDGADPFEKAAEFQLADTATILEALYPSQVKTAAAKAHDAVVSTEYSYSPASLLARKHTREKAAAAADVNWRQMQGQEITTPTPLPTENGRQYKAAMSNISRRQDTVEETRRQKSAAFDQMGHTFMALTAYFRRPDAHPLPVVKEAAVVLHGPVGGHLLDRLLEVTPGLLKMGSHNLGSSLLGVPGRSQFNLSFTDLDCTQAPFPLVTQLLAEVADYQEKTAAHQAAVDAHAAEAGNALRPFAHPAVSSSILSPSCDGVEKRSAAGPAPWSPMKALGTYSLVNHTLGPVADRIQGPDDDSKLNKIVQQLNDPAHEMQLRGINTQAMLQNLMSNDPIISGYDQDEVSSAFNDITQISPSVADQQMLMKALLRKHLQQGQLDTFEQDQLLGFEDKLRKQYQPSGRGDASIL